MILYTCHNLYLIIDSLKNHIIESLDLKRIINNYQIIDDYIFLCFLLGNDFMNHIPSLNLRYGGHDILLSTYSSLQDRYQGYYQLIDRRLDNFELDKINTSIAGPKRPQDLIKLDEISKNFKKNYNLKEKKNTELENGSIVIAAITSCTNTSNPNLMIAAALLAKKALKLGLKTKAWVKTSLAPGSKVVTDYLKKANLQNI